MLKTITLILLINNPDGSQFELSRSVPMYEQDCAMLQRNVWAMPDNPLAFIDEDGAAHRYDAACVPLDTK